MLIPQLPAPDSGKRGLGGAAAAAPRPARCCPPTPPAAGCRSRGRPDLGPSQVGPLFCVLALLLLLLLLANRNSLQISEFRQWTLLLLLSETKKKKHCRYGGLLRPQAPAAVPEQGGHGGAPHRHVRRHAHPAALPQADPQRRKQHPDASLLGIHFQLLKLVTTCRQRHQFSVRQPGVTHVLVTGGAGYIGSHAALRLLKDSFRVTIVDNLSRGNIGAIKVLRNLYPEPGRLQFIQADLGDPRAVS